MKISPLLLLLLISVVVMGALHFLALEFHLYWQYTWFDVPMHILGGAVIAFSVLSLPGIGVRLPERYFTLMPVLAIVLIVGLSWELFEIWIDIPLFEPGFEKDMVKDLLMDVLGGGIGFLVGTRINELEHV